jgi:hypothetical protein
MHSQQLCVRHFVRLEAKIPRRPGLSCPVACSVSLHASSRPRGVPEHSTPVLNSARVLLHCQTSSYHRVHG